MTRRLAAVTLLALASLQGCKTGYNRTYNYATDTNPPDCATANGHLSADGLKVFNLLKDFTCAGRKADGYLVGQNLGYGNEINNPESLTNNDVDNHSYQRLIEGFDDITSHTPAVVSIDYEYKRLYSEATLEKANGKLKQHWDAGGLVSISWMPLNPWENDFSDISGNPGTSMDVFAPEAGNIDLADLWDDTTDVYEVWHKKLDAMAVALNELKDDGVVVLWRPLPEMNTDTYWWGTGASDPVDNSNGGDLYKTLWKNMFDYFKDKGVDNLLWVYSPAPSSDEYSINWAYPGEKFVDVVAGIARNNELNIKDYQDMVDLGRPVAMAEYSPNPASDSVKSLVSAESDRGTFDNATYADRLNGSYPAVAYWVSWHSSALDDETRSNLALVDNLNSKTLADRAYVISLERMNEDKLRE